MKRVFRKISAVVTALAGLLTTVVLDMPMLTVSAATNGVTDNNVKWTYDGTTLTLSQTLVSVKTGTMTLISPYLSLSNV